MAYKTFSVGLVIAFAGMCLCQQQSTSSSSPSQYQSTAVSQASFQAGSAAALQQPQTKLEDIERDTLVAAFGQKTQQPSSKPSSAAPSVPQQPPSQQPPQSYQAVPQQQYFVQPYQALPQQFYAQPYQTQQQQYIAQPYQMAFDYAGVQYSVVGPNSYPGNQVYQQYYVPVVPQPSAVPEYVTKQSFPAAAPAQVQQEYKQQQFSAPAQAQQVYKQQQFAAVAPGQAQQEYKQQQFAAVAAPAQAQQEYKQQQFNALAQAQQQYKQVQQQYVVPSPAYQYVLQPAAPATNGPADYSYSTRHPVTTGVQSKAPTAAAVQPQYQYNALPQQYQQQQPQYYYTAAAAEQPRVQQSAKSQFSSGVKSTTPTPLVKEQFAYKFESSPQQQQPGGAAYSTLRFSA